MLDIHQSELLDEAQQAARPVAEPVRLAAPESFGRKRDRVGLRAKRQRQGRRQRVAQVVAAEGCQVEHFTPPHVGGLRRRPPNQIAAPRFGDQRKDQVATGIQVVDGDEQLAESWLTKVLDEQLHVAAGQDGPGLGP